MKRAYQCKDLKEVFNELRKVELPPVKILITGNGRVSRGGLEILEAAGIRKVDPEQYLFQQFLAVNMCVTQVIFYFLS